MLNVYSMEDIEDMFNQVLPEESESRDFKMWQVSTDGLAFFPEMRVLQKEKMDPGLYKVDYSNQQGYYAIKKSVSTDGLVKIHDKVINNMIKETKLFWGKADMFKEARVIHKRGIILVGGPGNGKSSIINLMCKELEKIGGIAFRVDDGNELLHYRNFIHDFFRKIEPETPILLIIEDIDKIVANRESELLNILDGQDCINHQLVLATSNRLEELNDLLLRPSRFDWIITVDKPTESSRRKYLSSLGIKDDELDMFVSKSDGLSLAQTKELFVAVKLLDNNIDLVIERLKDNESKTATTTYKPVNKKSIGFGGKN